MKTTLTLQEAIKRLQQQDPALTKLDLMYNSIGEAGAKALSKALMVNQTLTSLNLSHNSIDDAGVKALGKALTVNRTLNSLDLRKNSVGEAGAKALAEALTVNQTLTSLDLSGNYFGEAGAKALAEALTVNQTLTSLDFSETIGAAIATALSEVLKGNKVNRTLISLDLHNNGIDDAGVKALSKALRVTQALTKLDLYNNVIRDAGAKALAEVLKVNRTFISLDLHNNGIGDAGVTALAEALRVNRTLTKLDLRFNARCEEGAEALAEALRVNRALIELYYEDRSTDLQHAIQHTLEHPSYYNRNLRDELYIEADLQRTIQRTLEHAFSCNRNLRDELYAAIDKNTLEAVKTLLAEGVSILAQDKANNTPLHRAMRKGHESIVRYLASEMRQHGVPFTLRNKQGKTARDLAKNATQRTWLEATSEGLSALKEATQTLQALSLKTPPSLVKEEQAPLPIVAPPVVLLPPVKGTVSPTSPPHFDERMRASLPASPPAVNEEKTPILVVKDKKPVTPLVAPVNKEPQSAIAMPQAHLLIQVPYSELTLNHELGQGAFGIVYRGTWRYNDVAIKQLHLKHPTLEALAEFEREMALMAQLHSPHIVHLYAICKEPGHYGMVMEYAAKGSLYQVLHNPNETLPWLVRENIALGIAKGLAYLHLQAIIHRDLKSLNVLLDNQYQPKLTDFGLAKVKTATASTATVAAKTVGTYAWMAPEILGLKPKYSSASDMYAYAIVVWELTSRKVPFEAARGDYHIIRSGVLEGEREDIPAETPPKLARLITWGWKAKPDERPQAAQAIELLASPEAPATPSSTAAIPVYLSNLYSHK